MAEKTEKATPKKLRDARKKGQVAKSKDFPAAFTFVVSISIVLSSSTYLFKNLGGLMIAFFKSISGNIDMQNRAGGYITIALQMIFSTSIPIMIAVCIVGVLVNFLIIGPVFSFEAMKPDIKKLNPVTNLKNLFKVKTFVELLKSIFKIAGALVLIYSVIWNSIPQIVATAAMPITGTVAVFSDFLVKVIIRVGIFFLIIGILDLIFQKKNFAKEMKMEKFEVKQEMKDTEGNPEIKGKRKQAAREVAYQDGPSAAKRAKAIITNPVHIAVAIEYDAETEPAPKIITMGKGIIADKIIKVGQENHVPIMRNVPLAQELYNNGQISQYVPEETYEAIAEILKWIAQLEKEEEYNTELFK